MQKFFVKNNQIKGEIIEILGQDVNHIINVLRLKNEDEIQVCTIEDIIQNYIVKIIKYEKEKVTCKIICELNTNVETNINVSIYQGLPKADKMELIIQKTTEIGVKKIIPVQMERSIVKLNEKDVKKKIERWQKIAEVAAKQSKRDIIPKIGNVIKIQNLCDKIKEYDLFIVAYENEEEITLKQILKQNKQVKNIGVLVGPEGGIEEKEIQQLVQSGAKVVSLGKRILRTETAPIAITSNIIYEFEN